MLQATHFNNLKLKRSIPNNFILLSGYFVVGNSSYFIALHFVSIIKFTYDNN